MQKHYDTAFSIIVGLEGRYSNDPNDPGGETVFGLAKRFNPEVSKDMTLEQAKEIYYKKYWLPQGCNQASFPLDILLFDGAVNPQNDKEWSGSGNDELKQIGYDNWQEYLLLRMYRYMDNSKPEYVKGHLFRILKLYKEIKRLMGRKL